MATKTIMKNVAINAVLAATSAIANQSKTNNAVVMQNQAKNAANANQNQITATNLVVKVTDLTKAIDQAIKTVMNQTVAMIKTGPENKSLYLRDHS